MPEESFMKYTKDSRTVTPIPTTSSKPSSAHHQEEVKRKDDKKPINVDMRDSVDRLAVIRALFEQECARFA